MCIQSVEQKLKVTELKESSKPYGYCRGEDRNELQAFNPQNKKDMF